jgi:hypothetical protein
VAEILNARVGNDMNVIKKQEGEGLIKEGLLSLVRV